VVACDDAGEPFGPMVKLLLITGARLRECAEMTRKRAEGPTWTIPGARTRTSGTHHRTSAPMGTEIIDGSDGDCGRGLAISSPPPGETPVSASIHAKAAIDRAMLKAARDEALTTAKIPPEVTIAPWRPARIAEKRRLPDGTGRRRCHVIERAVNTFPAASAHRRRVPEATIRGREGGRADAWRS